MSCRVSVQSSPPRVHLGEGPASQVLVLDPRLQVEPSQAEGVVGLVDEAKEVGVAPQAPAVAVARVLLVLPVSLPLQLVHHPEPGDALEGELGVGRVHPGVLGGQDVPHQGLDGERQDMGGGLPAVVGDRVTGQLEHVEEAQTAEARLLPIDGEEDVVRLVRCVGGRRLLVGAAQGEPRPRGQVVAAEGVVALPVRLVGIVGQVVVLESGRSSRCCSDRCRRGTPDDRRDSGGRVRRSRGWCCSRRRCRSG